jgi:hypothetical protein
MKTNNFFDLDRFIGLLKQDILFNYKFYVSFIAGLSIGIYLFSYSMIKGYSGGFLSVNYILYNLLNGAIMVFVGMSFPAFRNQINTSNYLLMPGSVFEKMLVQFVVRIVLFIPLALVLLKFCIFLALSSMVPDPKVGFDPLFVEEFRLSEIFERLEVLKYNPLRNLAYLFLAFAGSVYFKKYALVKTLGVMLLFPGSVFIITKFTGGQINWLKAGTDYLNGYNFYFSLSPIFIGLLMMSLPWAYFKLKEKEL